jgi:hypothetical protein
MNALEKLKETLNSVIDDTNRLIEITDDNDDQLWHYHVGCKDTLLRVLNAITVIEFEECL